MTPLKNYDKCPTCGSEQLKESDTLHCWIIEYKCGYKIAGALDTDTHGDEYEIITQCDNNKTKNEG